MCNPALIGAGVTLGSGAASANAQRNSAEYNAAVGEINAEISEQQAQDAIARGEADVSAYRTQINALRGRQRAAIGSSNIEMSGSALDLMVDTATVGELDIQTIRNNAAREAYGYRVQGLNQRLGGTLDRYEGRARATGTLLTSAASAYGNYYQNA